MASAAAKPRRLLPSLLGQPPVRDASHPVHLELADANRLDEPDAAQPAERRLDVVRRGRQLCGDLLVRERLMLREEREDAVSKARRLGRVITFLKRERGRVPRSGDRGDAPATLAHSS